MQVHQWVGTHVRRYTGALLRCYGGTQIHAGVSGSLLA